MLTYDTAVNDKVVFLEKYGTGPPNSTGAYELDYMHADDFEAAWRTMHVMSDVFVSILESSGRYIVLMITVCRERGASRQGWPYSFGWWLVPRFHRGCPSLRSYRISWRPWYYRYVGDIIYGRTEFTWLQIGKRIGRN